MKRLNEMMCAALLACALCAFGCNNSSASDDYEPPVTVNPGDNVVFSNQTEFAVKVYSDSMRSVLVADVAAKKGVSSHVDVVPTGNVFYFSYFMDVNGVSVPYGVTDGYAVMLGDGSATSVKITDPKEVNTNKRIILLKNEADSAVVLYKGNIEERPEGNSSSLVNGGGYGIYILGALDDIANINIVEGVKSVPLSTAADFENGYIYTVVYDGTKIYMRSKSFLDRNMSKKIWKISLSQDTGKTLLAGVFKTRENPKNGYMLFGRQVYAAIDSDDVMNNGAIPYYAFISSEGNLTTEQSFSFADNPKSARFRDVAEYGDYILVAGIKDSADGCRSAFVSSVKGCNIYKDVYPLPDSYVASHACNIIHKKGNVFCVALIAEEEKTERYRSVLVETTIDGYTSVTTNVLWESSDERDLDIKDLMYDEATDTYIVLGAEYKSGEWSNSYINFIDGASGNSKQKELIFDKYDFAKCSKVGDKLLVCGSFKSAITGKDEACFQFIDIVSGQLDSAPTLFSCENKSLSNCFKFFIYEDDALLLVGYTDREGERECYPYLVKYDLKSKSIVFEQKYTDLNGYEIYSCHPSDIGFIFELYNETTMHSFLISSGLLGELPETTLLTLPKNPSKIIAVPDIEISFFNDYSSDDMYDKTTFKYGNTITLADLERYADAPNGYSVVGWYDWKNGDEEDVEVSFPFVITESKYLYPKIKISPPIGVYGYALSDSEIYVQWDAHPVANNYYLYWSDSFGNSYSTPVNNSSYYTISGLSSSSSYKISVIAYDSDKREWSDHSVEYMVQIADNWSSVPSGAYEMSLNTGNRYINLYSGEAHYYYAYFEAGRNYRVSWADSDNKTGLDGYSPIADIVLYVYYAGDDKGDRHDTDSPLLFNCTRSGYYIMEVQGYSSSVNGYYAIQCDEN